MTQRVKYAISNDTVESLTHLATDAPYGVDITLRQPLSPNAARVVEVALNKLFEENLRRKRAKLDAQRS